MDDKRELLKQPLHGIYIPILLMLVGTLIFGVEYLPYTIAIIVVVSNFMNLTPRDCRWTPSNGKNLS